VNLPWKRLFGFGALQLFTAAAPILVLPVVVRLIGVEGWVGLSIGYAVGAASAIAVNLAWPITGPSRVAPLSPADAADVFLESVVTRFVVAVPVSLLGVVVSAVLSPPGHRVLAAAMCTSTAVGGLASNWYYIGRGEPRGIFTYEALPKLVATAVTIPLVALTDLAILYPVLLFVSTVWGVVASSRRILGPYRGTARMPDGSWHRMRHYAVVASSAVVGAGYTSLAVPITKLSGAALAQVADFAGSLRIRSMAQMAPASSTSALQGWVSETGEGGRLSAPRMRRALGANTAIGLLTGLIVAVLGPFLSDLLFGDSATISVALAVLTGAACIPYAISASLSFHVLAPLGATGSVAASRVAATAVGVPLLFLLARRDGATGAALAALISESLVVVIQAVTARRVWRADQSHAAAHDSLSASGIPEL
jgi:O-antigen/teichoic acid export membrane protein